MTHRIENLLQNTQPWYFAGAGLFITVLKTGIWYIPNIGTSVAIAIDPFRNPLTDPDAHYIFWSWLDPFIAWLLGLNSESQLIQLNLIFSLASTILVSFMAIRQLPRREANISILFFNLLPISGSIYFWIGLDSLTFFLMTVALLARQKPWLALLMGFLLGTQHFEQGFFSALALSVAIFASQHAGHPSPYNRRYCISWLAGIVLGKIALIALFKTLSIGVESSRLHYVETHLGGLFMTLFIHFQVILWSLLGAGWLILALYINATRTWKPMALGLLTLLPILVLAGDQTRVLAITTYPLLAVFWLLNQRFLSQINHQMVYVLALLWLISPWYFIWGGHPKDSVLAYDAMYLANRIWGFFSVPSDPALWPFN